jgi:hypothetical protein
MLILTKGATGPRGRPQMQWSDQFKERCREGGDWRRTDEIQEWADRDSRRLLCKEKCGNDLRRKKKNTETNIAGFGTSLKG